MRTIGRGFFGFFTGGSQPRDVAAALLLGLMAGFLLGFNYATVVLLIAALLLNVHSRTLLASLLMGGVGGHVLEPFSYDLGRWALEQPLARGLIAVLGDSPLATLLGVNDYVLVGVLAPATAISVLMALLGARITRRLRANPSLVGHDGRLSIISATVAGLLFGRDRQRRADVLSAPPRRFRPGGVVVALAVTPVALIVPWCITEQLAQQALLRELAAANGAEVMAGSIELSLWTGELVMDDVRFADPADARSDRLRIRHVTGRVSPSALLRGHLHADHLKAEGIRTDVTQHGVTRFASHRHDRSDGTALPEYGDPGAPAGGPTTRLILHDNVRGWEQLGQRLGNVAQLVSHISQLENISGQSVPPGESGRRQPAERIRRCDPCRDLPRLMVETLHIEQLPRPWDLGPESVIEITNLTSDPVANGQPTLAQVVIPELAAELNLTLNLHEPGLRHDVTASAYRLPLNRLVAIDRYGPEIDIEDGHVDVVGAGWADAGQLNLELTIDAQRLHVLVKDDRPIAGLSPSLWNDVLGHRGRLQVQARLRGPWSRPRLELDRPALLRSLRRQMRAAGDEQLAEAIQRAEAGETAVSRSPLEGTLLERDSVSTAASRDEASDELPGDDLVAAKPTPHGETVARNPAGSIRPGVYPQTATPHAWVPASTTVLAASAVTRLEEARDDAVGSLSAGPPPTPDANPAAETPSTAVVVITPEASVESRTAIEPPAPVDLALGYDAEPFSEIDRQVAAYGIMPPQPIYEDTDLMDDGEEASPSRLARLSTQARQVIGLAWPFGRSGETDQDSFVAEQFSDGELAEYELVDSELAEYEAWETTAAPFDPDTSAAAKPWYQRIWR